MFLFILTVYHCLKSYYFPENRNDRITNHRKVIPEMQDIFESCTLEEDNKVRSSVVIEAVTLKYCLNDEVKCALVNKLDPDSLDITYSKEDLFKVFKDWISGNKSPNYISPLILPYSSRFHPSSTMITSSPLRITESAKSCFIPVSSPHSLEEYSYEAEDSFDLDDACSSHSSTKKKLTFHKSILESRLKQNESHTNSIEKKYETLNGLFEKQKLELERLKQEVKTHRDMEQCMEEMIEQMRKKEIEAETRYSKVQIDLATANSKIESFESMVTDLNENLLEAQTNLYKKESEYEIVRHKMDHLEIEASRKDGEIQELLKQVNVLERDINEKEFYVSVILDEKLALSNELNDLRERLLIFSQAQDIPLCDELPSAMLHFPESFISSSSVPSDTSLNSNRFGIIETTSSCSQTELRTVASSEAQTDLMTIENRSFTSSEAQTDLVTIENTSFTSSEAQTDLVTIENTVSNIVTTSSCSQTELRPVKSSEAQTDVPTIKVKMFTSQETQTDLLIINDKSWISRELPTETITDIHSTDIHLTQRFKYYLMILLRLSMSIMTTSLSLLVALFAILVMFLYVCQNGRCVPTLRFPRGSPPV